jgi:hypothetical protein
MIVSDLVSEVLQWIRNLKADPWHAASLTSFDVFLAAHSLWLLRKAREGQGFLLQDGDVPP